MVELRVRGLERVCGWGSCFGIEFGKLELKRRHRNPLIKFDIKIN